MIDQFHWLFEEKKDPSYNYLDEPHEYWLRQRRLWSPSSTFKQVGYVDDQYYTEESRIRGKHVHAIRHFVDTGGVDSASVDDAYLGYLNAYMEFKTTWRFVPLMSETPIYHPTLLYGVTPDSWGLILDGDPAIVEFKSGLMPWWTKLQTAAQALAIEAWEPQPIYRRRIGVQLRKDGKFKAEEHRDYDDYDTWRANIKTVQQLGEPPRKALEEVTAMEGVADFSII